MIWHYIASEIGCTVSEAKHRISFNEFLDWVLFFKRENTLRGHINAVGANIAYTIYSVNAKGKRLKFEDFVINYQKKDEDILKEAERFEKMFSGMFV